MENEILTGELISKIISGWFAFLLIFFGIITLILNYHWKQYGITEKTMKRLRRIYYSVSGVLIVLAVIMFLIYIRK